MMSTSFSLFLKLCTTSHSGATERSRQVLWSKCI